MWISDMRRGLRVQMLTEAEAVGGKVDGTKKQVEKKVDFSNESCMRKETRSATACRERCCTSSTTHVSWKARCSRPG